MLGETKFGFIDLSLKEEFLGLIERGFGRRYCFRRYCLRDRVFFGKGCEKGCLNVFGRGVFV